MLSRSSDAWNVKCWSAYWGFALNARRKRLPGFTSVVLCCRQRRPSITELFHGVPQFASYADRAKEPNIRKIPVANRYRGDTFRASYAKTDCETQNEESRCETL